MQLTALRPQLRAITRWIDVPEPSDLELLPPDLRSRSASPREIVLPLADALEAIAALRAQDVTSVGWEGWVRGPDGRLGHAPSQQGTVEFFPLSECETTMREAQREWNQNPDIEGGELLFCLSPE